MSDDTAADQVLPVEHFVELSRRLPGDILRQLCDAVIVIDTRFRIVYANEAAAQQYECPVSEMLGRPLTDIHSYVYVNGESEADTLREVRERGEWRGENIHLTRSGRRLHVESVVSEWRGADGHPLGLIAIIRDVTARKVMEARALQHERELQALAAELRQADRRKDEFIATLSHELRNPLAPLRTALTLLWTRQSGDAMAERLLDIMERQFAQLVRLVDDLLEVNRIGAGKLLLRPAVTEMSAVVQAAIEAARPAMDDARHTCTVPPEWPAVQVLGDQARLAQVFGNLLQNAVKYTPPGGHIVITMTVQPHTVTVAVADDGVGLTDDQLSTVFDMYAQAASSHGQRQGGLGIGLALAKQLVELHGGRITASSQGPGRGSTFAVCLPIVHAEALATGAPDAQLPAAPARPLTVLVVDDNRDAADTLALLLDMLGHDATSAYDGSSALAIVEAAPPDVVLLDLNLPGMAGDEVCRRIRETAHPCPMVIAVTGGGSPDSRQHALDGGFHQFLLKPLEPWRLAEMLADVPSRRHS